MINKDIIKKRKVKNRRLLRFLKYKYGDMEGKRKFWVMAGKRELKYYIFMYGKELGNILHKKHLETLTIKGTKQYYINKYGDVEGLKKYLEKNSKLSVGYNALKKSGKSEDEIKEIQNRHSSKSSITLKNMIRKYGDVEGQKKYERYINKTRISVRSVKELVERGGYSEKEAIKIVSGYQTRNLDFFIKKYGEKDGVSDRKSVV